MPDMLVRLYSLEPPEVAVRALEAQGVICRRAESFERAPVVAYVRERWPGWVDETIAAFGRVPPSVFIALRGAAIVGFACFHATRPNFFGPTGVDEAERGKGIGRALLRLALAAMAGEGYAYAIIGGVRGRESFYEEAVGATVIPASDPGIYGGRAGEE